MTPRVFPANASVHVMGRPNIYGVLRDVGGQSIDVVSMGADPTGTGDSTGAIGAAITEAALSTPPKAVLLSPGRFKTTGDFDLTGKHGLTIRGAGVGATTIEMTHATNDLFKYGTAVEELRDITISDFSVTATANGTRTGGWVLRGHTASPDWGPMRRCKVENLDIKKQVNGLWFNQYEAMVRVINCFFSDFRGSGGIGIKGGQTGAAGQRQGSGLQIHNTEIYNIDFVAGGETNLSIGLYLEDVEGNEFNGSGVGGALDNGMKIVASSGNSNNNNFFDNSAWDNTKNGHNVHFTGAGSIGFTEFSDCWIASAGVGGAATSQNGIRVDNTEAVLGAMDMMFKGCYFLNNYGTGLYFAPTTGGGIVISDNLFRNNGLGAVANNNDAIYTALPAGVTVGFNINGNMDVGSNGVSHRIPAGGTTAYIITSNRWGSGVAHGVAPAVNANNV